MGHDAVAVVVVQNVVHWRRRFVSADVAVVVAVVAVKAARVGFFAYDLRLEIEARVEIDPAPRGRGSCCCCRRAVVVVKKRRCRCCKVVDGV